MKKVASFIKTAKKVTPMIYAYTTPGVIYHDGYIKIGYTEIDVDTRIRQQTHTAGVKPKKEWQGNARYEDGSGDTFKDTQFFVYLRRLGVKQPQDLGNEYFDEEDKNEWFHISPQESKRRFFEFRENRGVVQGDLAEVLPYELREEQQEAVRQTIAYRKDNEGKEFLWNAKPRFGKTLAAYDFVKKIGAQKVLIVTNMPAIANSWYDDYEKFIGRAGGYFFVSKAEGIQFEAGVMSYNEYERDARDRENDPFASPMGLIDLVSLQDLKGSLYFGGDYDKLKEVRDLEWDVLIVDEAHEGVDTYKTDAAFEQIKRKFTLHLSGTPFKALAKQKFPDAAIFSWTYADEQEKKRSWSGSGENPYAELPRLNLLTYQMSEIVREQAKQGIEIDGDMTDYAFDLNEFFATNERGRFIHEAAVDKFLDALTSQEKFPFSTPELRNELKHTFWLLDRVDSVKALAKKLNVHPVFGKYKVVIVAGDERSDDMNAAKDHYDRVIKAIANYDKTITLSVDRLTTGVTIPQWTAVMMLSNIKSPAKYMQAAFRAQNPCLFNDSTGSYRKENAYVFDFAPDRTLTIFEQFANDLSKDTSAGRGDSETRKKNIRELLNFFPVIGEDEEGEMTELDAEKVLSIPRKIKCQEVVRRGFMCDFLFQNITNVFRAPSAVLDIIQTLTPTEAPSDKGKIDTETAAALPLNEEGEVDVPQELIIGKEQGIFGEKIYGEVMESIAEAVDAAVEGAKAGRDDTIDTLLDKFKAGPIAQILEETRTHYGNDLKPSVENRLKSKLTTDAQGKVTKVLSGYNIQTKTIEKEREDALRAAGTSQREREKINKEFDSKRKEADEQFQAAIETAAKEFVKDATQETVKAIETNIAERKKDSIADMIRDHLRGFSRTIPSFIMAYGDKNLTLANFDDYTEDDVFLEVTGITEEDFRLLRDGGTVLNKETGKEEYFEGHLFDEVVFNDSVQEFLRKKEELADYFDESKEEDIFDYIPPQKTNQIFTPRWVVKKMADELEEENPGCFDDPTKTFADLYMKSGLYITEIVKRLYRSKKIKAVYPDDGERIRHILREQVYGMAPTRIIYLIATNFILGFDETLKHETKNFVEADAAEAAKRGTLQALVDEKFGKK